MIQKIIEKLSQRKLSAWQIRESKKRSYQSFLALNEKECERTVETTKYRITLHKKKEGDKPVMGISSFQIAEVNFSGLDALLDMATTSAEMTSNQPFELPEQPKELPSVDILDSSLEASTLKGLEDRLRQSVAKEKEIRLSAAEFFIDRVESRLRNSRGLDLSQEESFLHLESILLSKSGGKENEYINRYTRRYLSDFDLEGEIKTSAQNAREATRASLPKTGKFAVLFSEEPMDKIFEPLIARTSARLKYNRMLEVEVGKSVVDGNAEGDSVSIWANNLLDKSAGSFKFDSYGTPAGKTCLIENNKVMKLLSDKRYSDYLNVPVTGELGTFEVLGGTRAFSDLEKLSPEVGNTLYHIQAFSAFEPNAITGAFSAEIRTGHEITAKGIRPIKGGSVSGVLQKALVTAWLSKETAQRERCLVPKGILFKNLDIAGN